MTSRSNVVLRISFGVMSGLILAFAVTALNHTEHGTMTDSVEFGYAVLAVGASTSCVACFIDRPRLRNWTFGASVMLTPALLVAQISCCL